MKFYMAVLHYTMSGDVSAAVVNQWHKARGFKPRGINPLRYIGYHYLVRQSGAVELGRSLTAQPTHCPGYNKVGVLAICFCGADNIWWYPTEEQYASGAMLLAKHEIPEDRIYGHGQLHPTSCPGRLNIPKVISLMGGGEEEEEMPRFELVRVENGGDGKEYKVYACGLVNQNQYLDIHCEAEGHSYDIFVYKIPRQGNKEVKMVTVGGWDNRDHVYGATYKVGDLFPGCGDTRMVVHSPAPLAIEVS